MPEPSKIRRRSSSNSNVTSVESLEAISSLLTAYKPITLPEVFPGNVVPTDFYRVTVENQKVCFEYLTKIDAYLHEVVGTLLEKKSSAPPPTYSVNNEAV